MIKTIFVFGSNRRGVHGAGAAKYARRHFKAEWGVGEGITGRAYALPTKDHEIQTLPLAEIQKHVDTFVEYAKKTPENTYMLTRVGCGLAGYTDTDIVPLFPKPLPDNVVVPPEWKNYFPDNSSWYKKV